MKIPTEIQILLILAIAAFMSFVPNVFPGQRPLWVRVLFGIIGGVIALLVLWQLGQLGWLWRLLGMS